MRLRTRITVATTAAAIIAALGSAAVVTYSARSFILENQQNAYLEDFMADASSAARNLPAHPTRNDLELVEYLFPYPTALENLHTGAASGTLALSAVPAGIRDIVESEPSPVTYLRTTIGSEPVFVVGFRMTASSSDTDGDPVGVYTSYPLDDEFDQVSRFLLLAAATAAFAAVLAAVAGLIVARVVVRPLRTLATAAASLADEHPITLRTTGDADLDAVISALEQSSQRLTSTVSKLRRSEADSRRLAADVSHELRTPLTSMVAVSEVLEDEDAPGHDRREAANIIARNTRHLARLTEDVLEISRLDSSSATARMERIDAASVVRELAEIRLWDTVHLAIPPELWVTTDRARFSLIATNLVNNALRHGAQPVELALHRQDNVFLLTISDAGHGVAQEHEPYIFDRFFKIAPDRARSDSSGLGLAIVRENARLLGGDVVYRRESGRTTFDVTLPLTPRPAELHM